ncbi:MAG TPA: LysR family transcriptional regulator [Allosphingosinicella sp.]|nr:LysR family transcriptional regulator [Allosphingosinicella sp.]
MNAGRDLEYLRVLVAAADAGSLSAAARKLGVTQPVLSRKLAGLERRLGMRLALRSPRAFILTNEGRQLYESSRDILDRIETTFESMDRSSGTVAGRLRVTAPDAFGARHIAPLLVELQQRHPRLAVELLIVDRVVDLVVEGIDLAIRVGTVEDTNLKTMRVADFDYVFVAAPSYLSRHPPLTRIEQLAQHDLVAYGTATGFTPLRFRKDGGVTTVQACARLASNNVHAVRAALLAGAGVGMATRWFVNEDLAQGRLVELFSNHDLPRKSFSIAHPFLSYVPLRVRVARDFLAERIRQIEGLRRAPGTE